MPLPAAGNFAPLVGREIAVGLRPEAWRLNAEGPVFASVVHTEQIGAEQLVHATIDCPGIDVVADEAVNTSSARAAIQLYVSASAVVSLWEPLRLTLDPRETHVFDLATGRRIGDLSGGAATCDLPRLTASAVTSGTVPDVTTNVTAAR